MDARARVRGQSEDREGGTTARARVADDEQFERRRGDAGAGRGRAEGRDGAPNGRARRRTIDFVGETSAARATHLVETRPICLTALRDLIRPADLVLADDARPRAASPNAAARTGTLVAAKAAIAREPPARSITV